MRSLAGLAIAFGLAVHAQEPAPIAKFGTTVVIPDGFRGQIYFLKEGATELPKFSKLKPKGTIYTTSINVPEQRFDQGFPGVTQRFEWFAIDYTARFWVRSPGIHRFILTSDDGSRLWIDGHLVVDNDGVHPPQDRYGDIDLAGGLHRIEVGYFQGPRFAVALVLKVMRPGERWRIFQVDEFKPPPDVEIPPDLPVEKGKKRK
jgi:hypothetical protein